MQIIHQVRGHAAVRRPRGVVSRTEARDALEAFQQAIESGDLQSLLDMLAPDVVFPVTVASRAGRACPSWGPDRVAHWLPG